MKKSLKEILEKLNREKEEKILTEKENIENIIKLNEKIKKDHIRRNMIYESLSNNNILNLPSSGKFTSATTATTSPLLDDYPGAGIAFSLRLLNSSYSGSCIRVRRTSDNTEQDIGFVDNELDTATLLSFVGTQGFVVTWYDQSGNGRNATTAITANQAGIVDSGIIYEDNGKVALNFNADYYDFTSALDPGSSYTTFGVSSRTDTVSIVPHIGSTSGTLIRTPALQNSSNLFAMNGKANRVTSSVTDTAINQMLLVGTSISNTLAIYKNGNTIALDPPVSSAANNTFGRLGRTSILNQKGKAQEFIIYDSDQSSNRVAIETDIINYYGIV